MQFAQLLEKYNKPIPRYTSYPTVPYWQNEKFNSQIFLKRLKEKFDEENNVLSLYIHLPYCEELCTYCACNKRITKNHGVEEPYINALLKEWELYKNLFGRNITISEIHLGGGTPTFFSSANLERLIKGITTDCVITNEYEFSIEIHPNYTTREHLKVLNLLGFNRISIGIQDFDKHVQFLINRPQTFEQTENIFRLCREYGFNSLNADLVYGLPHQTVDKVESTINQLLTLSPDRIAFYSYAHVPWKSKGQRRYKDEDVPSANEKLNMYLKGKEMLNSSGFFSIGMDHFAKKDDLLFKSSITGNLHRNFMGYTTNKNKVLIGLGASSISDSWTGFAQNEKEVETYLQLISNNEFAFISGHILTDEDIRRREIILQLMCNFEADFDKNIFDEALISEYLNDELIEINSSKIKITDKGKLFVRNICASADAYLQKNSETSNIFSKSV